MSDVQPDNQQPETQEAETKTPVAESNAEVNDTPSVAADDASAPESIETASTETPTESSTETTQTPSAEAHTEEPAAESAPEPPSIAASSQPAPAHEDADSIFASDTSIPHESAEGETASAATSQADGDPGKPESEKAAEPDSPIMIPPEVLAECKAKTLGRLLEETQRKSTYVTNLISLLEQATPISFIAHYRKELTGSMDEPTIRELKERYETLFELELRKQAILVTIGALGKMTPELEQRIREAVGRTELDDLYLPFRPKRKNRATVAKSKGLEPLAARIFETRGDCEPLHELAINYLNPRRGVNTIQQALAGAAHIIAEWIAEDSANRKFLRDQFAKSGRLVAKAAKGKENERSKYESFYKFSESIREVPSHRFLAIRRGEREKFLSVGLEVDRSEILRHLNERYVAAPYQPPSESSTAALLAADTGDDEHAAAAKPETEEVTASPSAEVHAETASAESETPATAPEATAEPTAIEASSTEETSSPAADGDSTPVSEEGAATDQSTEPVEAASSDAEATEAAPTDAPAESTAEAIAAPIADAQASLKTEGKKPQSLHPASSEVNAAEFLRVVINDSFDRLLLPAIDGELRNEIKRRADSDAIDVFAQNLGELLFAPPAGPIRVLGINPGLKTGCKVAVITETGKFIFHGTIYPHPPQKQWDESKHELKAWITQYQVAAVAIGNGSASRETLQLAREVAHEVEGLKVALVNEAGVSVYSTSRPAREEFPELEASIRGAVSIARRLQDPLAELVKVEPRSIGVGQYQHDVDQGRLRRALNAIVESCVNRVSVDINTASVPLLSYVAGVGTSLAREISGHRSNIGRFNNRQEIANVPRFTPEHFEHAAGFFRIREGNNPLDNTAIHPEKYALVDGMAARVGVSTTELVGNKELISQINLQDFVDDLTGLPTLRDIVDELRHPGRDPRQKFETVDFREDIRDIGDLKVGMELEGLVSNITNFGAFIDVGVHQDGLVHISHLSRKFIKDPHEAVHVGQKVKVKVIEVDTERRRIGLSVKDALPAPPPRPKPQQRPRQEARGQAAGGPEGAPGTGGDRRGGRGDGRGRRGDQRGGRPRDDRRQDAKPAGRPDDRQRREPRPEPRPQRPPSVEELIQAWTSNKIK